MTVRMLYFAWVREKTGVDQEAVELPPDLNTVADLLAWQARRGPEFEAAFADTSSIRVALDQTHAKADSPLAGAAEIAFFPPVTGG